MSRSMPPRACRLVGELYTSGLEIVRFGRQHQKVFLSDAERVDNFGLEHSVARSEIFARHVGDFVEAENGHFRHIKGITLVDVGYQAVHVARCATCRQSHYAIRF